MRLRAAAAAPALLLAPLPAYAQAYQCRVPEAAPPVPPVTRGEPERRAPLAGYTLALSWSPEFCRFRANAPEHVRQCSGRNGRFGFIVHGLWPEGEGGRRIQWCNARQPAPNDLRPNLCLTPSAPLLVHEWAKHGSCMAQRPATYFRIERILWNSLRWPDFDRLSRRQGLTAGAIRAAFAEANPYWEPEHVGLVLNPRGWLQEMRLCYGKDFMPADCDRRRYGPADEAPVKIWRGL
ncbi:ribonuclease T2 family protein [Croceibacterium soli]|uniref:ribonuclease T2 family protein n=1 Tax=Croceibacterium soli TaxID=1739690 RepID=UPI001F36DFB8|nr:ribonuclease T [Croceibacterium soli]